MEIKMEIMMMRMMTSNQSWIKSRRKSLRSKIKIKFS